MTEREQRLVNYIRLQRSRQFLKEKKSYAPERQWEDEDEFNAREKYNERIRREWDEETEKLIQDLLNGD